MMTTALAATTLPLVATTAPSAQAVSGGVVVSQVYGGGGNSGGTLTHDFIELFNRRTAAVDMTGWSVQYASATGTGNFRRRADRARLQHELQDGQPDRHAYAPDQYRMSDHDPVVIGLDLRSARMPSTSSKWCSPG